MGARSVLGAAVAALALSIAPAVAQAADVVDVPITFHVVNRNTTGIPCLGAPDGKSYAVHGEIVAPAAALSSGNPAATLYLNGFGYGSWFFHFTDVPGYDYATQQAQAGHVSVLVDRLGNPAHNDLRDGNATCLPAQADMAAQMIGALRAGSYDIGSGAPAKFHRVLLAGHSAGGFITEIEQETLHAADAIAVISYTDTPSPLTLATFAQANATCFLSPQTVNGAPHYAAFGASDASFSAGHFHDVDPAVAAIVLRKRNLDTCGELTNALQPLVLDQVATNAITVPVGLFIGANDALFSPPTGKLQALKSFLRSPQVTFNQLADTGHAVTLGRTHDTFRQAIGRWLVQQGA